VVTSRCTVIAEAGVNHNGDPDLALRMVEVAAQCGADVIKFQTFRASALATAHAPKAAYQIARTEAAESQRQMLERLELDESAYRELVQAAARAKLEFLSTPFDEASADLLAELGVERFKIPSGEVSNHPLLRHIARKRKPILLSTGMCTLADVEGAVAALRDAGCDELTLLHCTSSYPAPHADVNLRAMETLRRAFGVPVGLSDHTEGIAVATAAAALGASVIEKHFTLDRRMPGPDHAASLEPDELAQLVRAIRQVEAALGDGIKRPMPSELDVRRVARKSLVAARDLAAGTTLEAAHLCAKRPGDHISPAELDRVVGRVLRTSLRADEPVEWDHLR
jgi:N,N'-diacetyllegionaminate synthase